MFVEFLLLLLIVVAVAVVVIIFCHLGQFAANQNGNDNNQARGKEHWFRGVTSVWHDRETKCLIPLGKKLTVTL